MLLALSAGGCSRSPGYYLAKGNAQFAAHKYEDASLNYLNAIQKDARFGEAYYQLALAEFQLRRPAAAYQSLLRAVELLPARTDAKVKLADISLAAYMGDREHPKAMYDRVSVLADHLIATNPKSYDGLRLKGYLAMLDRKFTEAERPRGSLQNRP